MFCQKAEDLVDSFLWHTLSFRIYFKRPGHGFCWPIINCMTQRLLCLCLLRWSDPCHWLWSRLLSLCPCHSFHAFSIERKEDQHCAEFLSIVFFISFIWRKYQTYLVFLSVVLYLFDIVHSGHFRSNLLVFSFPSFILCLPKLPDWRSSKHGLLENLFCFFSPNFLVKASTWRCVASNRKNILSLNRQFKVAGGCRARFCDGKHNTKQKKIEVKYYK